RLLAWTISLTNLLDAGLAAVVIPVFVRRTYGEDASAELGLVFGAFGAGAVTGSVIFAAIGHRLPRRLTYLVAFLTVAASLWIYPLSPPLALLLLGRVIAGAAAGPLNPILMTVFQERVPIPLRGRVFGSLSAGVLAGSPLGVVAAGVTVERLGLTPTLVGIAALYVAVTLATALNPAMRLMNHRPRRVEVEHAPAGT
ncbi:MAG TPA: MFS transporter, partial [Thermomicrobiales bacterium]|nr:MFS transporter [Thermomicrobiales bacterium]